MFPPSAILLLPTLYQKNADLSIHLLTKYTYYVKITMGDIMDNNYELEPYTILSVTSYRLKEKETGEYWYPIVSFFDKILFRKVNSRFYRDNDKYNKYMRVISYINPNNPARYPVKAWFMNTEGIYLILKSTVVQQGTPKVTLMKQKYLAAAQSFFGVIPDTPEKFIGYTPNLSNYDVWSILCLTRDPNIKKDTLWKKCNECGFYYPNTKDYFHEDNKHYLANKCRQCAGFNFRCKNKKIQYLYSHDGYDLLYQYYLGENDKILDEFKKWIG